jgi:acyl-homoserine lactone acylase PvdQ
MVSAWRTLCLRLAVFARGSIAIAVELPGPGGDVGKTVVYRDTWGVPHIYGPTIEAGLYAMGCAPALDRPEDPAEDIESRTVLRNH